MRNPPGLRFSSKLHQVLHQSSRRINSPPPPRRDPQTSHLEQQDSPLPPPEKKAAEKERSCSSSHLADQAGSITVARYDDRATKMAGAHVKIAKLSSNRRTRTPKQPNHHHHHQTKCTQTLPDDSQINKTPPPSPAVLFQKTAAGRNDLLSQHPRVHHKSSLPASSMFLTHQK